MIDTKPVAVVIPNYNGEKFIKDCLAAVCSQSEDTPAYEVIVVDNGSTDGSVNILKSIEDDRVRVVYLHENTGFCGAVNTGIRESNAKFVILLNNDTRVETGFVKALYDAISNDGRIFSVSAKMLMWDAPERMDDAGDIYTAFGWSVARGKGKPEKLYNKRAGIFSACAGAAIYRREIFDEIGLFDERHFAYLEDLDVGYRARLCGYRNIYEPAARVLHYGSASSGSRYNAWKIKLSAANNVYVILKNMPILQLLLNLPFLLIGFAVKLVFFAIKGYGGIYAKGLGEGIDKALSAEGRARRFRFRLSRLPHYIVVHIELYLNIFRLFLKKI